MLFECFSAQSSGRFLDGFLKGRKTPLESSSIVQAFKQGTFVGLRPYISKISNYNLQLPGSNTPLGRWPGEFRVDVTVFRYIVSMSMYFVI